MKATDHKTYQDYVAFNRKLGYLCIPEDLYNNIKREDEMFELFKADMKRIIELPENVSNDGTINWDFVDADLHMTWRVLLDGEQYTNWFDEAADQFEKVNA